MTALKESILQTVIYADCFDYALTAEQIHHYQISYKTYSFVTFQSALNELVLSNMLIYQNGLYCLAARKNLFRKRMIAESVSAIKIEIARKKTWLMTCIPWIDGIWITGNVAMHNAQDDDDIDLLVVTRDSWLWLTRLIIVIVYGAVGRVRLRRHSLQSVKNKLCLNMYLDATVLEMPSSKKNLYTAHEVAQVLPLFNRNKTYERFLAANAWILKFLPHIPGIELEKFTPRMSSVATKAARIINRCLFTLQYHYMKHHLSRELVDEHRAFFHPRDTSTLITRKFTQRCADHGISVNNLIEQNELE